MFAVVIPARDCERTIGDVVAGARSVLDTVIVVNDGSRDATHERATAAGAIVLDHRRSRGKGAALSTGLAHARDLGVTHAVTMDGDGEHLPAELPRLLDASRKAPTAIVIGARRIDPDKANSTRLFGNRFANRWVEIACGSMLPDTQSGFRVYPLEKVASLGVRARHFAYETELIIRAVHAGVAIESVGVAVRYLPPEQRHSHYRGFVDTVRIIFVVLGLIFRWW